MNTENQTEQERAAAEAKKREKQKRARMARAFRDEMYREMGLTKVRGAVSGKTYWE